MRKYFLFFSFSLLLSNLFSQLSTVSDQTTYPFWLSLPSDSATLAKAPILIFLHGKSLSGTNLDRVKKYGVIKEIEGGRSIPAIVAAPQLPSGPWDPDKVLEIIEYIQRSYQTDSARIYVCGMSLGGYGTLHFAGKYADKITAAVALCGGGNVSDAAKLATIPLWIQHGNRDKAVPLSESQKVVNAIKKIDGSKLTFTIWPGADHAALERAFRQDELYTWLLAQRRSIY